MLLETIKYQDGEYPLLKWHQNRINRAFEELFSNQQPHDLKSILSKDIGSGIKKVRFIYDARTFQIETHEHHHRHIEKVKCIYDNQIEYGHKFENRTALEKLYTQRKEADEILIIKNDMITDALYYNPVFWDGSDWYVPDNYLLAGTRRAYLLDQGLVKKIKIDVNDIPKFNKLSLVNALVDLKECTLSTNQIII